MFKKKCNSDDDSEILHGECKITRTLLCIPIHSKINFIMIDERVPEPLSLVFLQFLSFRSLDSKRNRALRYNDEEGSCAMIYLHRRSPKLIQSGTAWFQHMREIRLQS
jgi:hypothetical protein